MTPAGGTPKTLLTDARSTCNTRSSDTDRGPPWAAVAPVEDPWPARGAARSPNGRLTNVNRPVTRTPAIRTLGARPFLAAGLLAAAAAALGACSTMNPSQTLVPYQQADGVSASSGTVQARDLLVVADAKGASGVLSGNVVNTGDDPVTVTFLSREEAAAGASKGTSISLQGRGQQRIDTVQLASVPNAPGDLTGIVMQTSAGRTLVNVPVLLPGGMYGTLTPTATPTATTTSATTTNSATSTVAPAGGAATTSTAPATTTTAAG